MATSARAIALQGLATPFALSAIALAVQGLLIDLLPEEPDPPPAGAAPARFTSPHRWVPYLPVKHRRPRKRRDADVLFLQ